MKALKKLRTTRIFPGTKCFDLIIVVQDRPRHKELSEKIRSLNCGISLIDSGSLTCIMDICLERGNYDALIGTYGAPEGLIGAVIAKATGSEFKSNY